MSLITCYNALPVSFTHGKGVWLYDEQDRAYLDGLSGVGVCVLGHAHPTITRTIQEQAAKLLHVSNGVIIREEYQLAERLTAMLGMEQAFFSNSGAEANEAAIKLTRLFGHKKGITTPSVIVMERAFHGRTMATLTASGNRKGQAGFDPLVPGFIRAPYNDLNALHTIAANRDDIVAIMLEPIQGEGGIHIADDSYLRDVAALCRANDWLLILDEVQTGTFRTGKLCTHMHSGIQPDIVTMAKGLANGIPIGACLMRGKACNLFTPGSHGSTFGGNPLACATALAVLDVLEHEKIGAHAESSGRFLKEKLLDAFSNYPQVKAIRSKGLMFGIELDRPAVDMRKLGLEHRVLFNITAECVVRLLPPLIISKDEMEELVRRLVKTVDAFVK